LAKNLHEWEMEQMFGKNKECKLCGCNIDPLNKNELCPNCQLDVDINTREPEYNNG